jgi:acetyl-CoA synthetase
VTDAIHPVPQNWAGPNTLSDADYQRLCAAARDNPDHFWRQQAMRIDWMHAPTRIKDVSFNVDDFRIGWFVDGVLNVSFNCIDRHLAVRGDQTALIFEGDEPGEGRRVSYRELHEEVCRFANVLKRRRQGRPRHPVHADDPGGSVCDARLCPDRRDPQRRLWRLFAR